MVHHGSDEEDDEDELLPHPEGDGENGYSYGGRGASSVPLMTRHAVEDEGDVVFDGDEELENQGLDGSNGAPGDLEVVPYAHRDLKPGCVIKEYLEQTIDVLLIHSPCKETS